jgi:hypothetical protein
MKQSRRGATVMVTVFVVALAIGALLPRLGAHWRGNAGGSSSAALLPALDGAGSWVRGFATSDSLRGRVVLVVMWSDTDPAALRVLPEVEAWRQAYGRYGLRVLGVHVPDFAFAADTAVVARYADRLGLEFPIVSDPSYLLSSRFPRTLERPSIYIADPQGRIVYQGGGAHTVAAHRALWEAIVAAHPDAGIPSSPPPAPVGELALSAPPMRLVYLGTSRADAGPLSRTEPGRAQTFTTQFQYQQEGSPFVAYPVGRWLPGAEGLVAARGGPDNFISVRGSGRVWAVLAPPIGASGRVWVLDGDAWLRPSNAGADVRFDARGAAFVEVTEPRLYEIAHCGHACVLKLSPELPGTAFHSLVFEPLAAR